MNQRWDQRPKICWAEWACNFLVERAKEKAARFLPNGECRGRSPSIRKQLAGNETRIYSKPIPPLLEVLKWLKYCFIPLYFSANSPGVHHSSSPCRKVPNFAKILKVDAHITSPLSHKRSDSLCSWFLDFPIKNCHPHMFANGNTFSSAGDQRKKSRDWCGKIRGALNLFGNYMLGRCKRNGNEHKNIKSRRKGPIFRLIPLYLFETG